jgi:tripartite-type tricarboxylate transporter receptor subunit TctC
MLVPFGPGGTTDLMARALQPELQKALGAPVVVVNRAGAGGAIALAELARAKPDGLTIAMTAIGPQVLQPAIKKLTYAPLEFDFICGIYDVPLMLMVKDDSPFTSVADVIAYARANPGRLAYGSSGQGTTLHITMAALLARNGVTGLHVPYKSSGDMVAGLLGGHVQIFMETPAVATQYRLRPLAVFADARLDAFPSVPSAGELGIAVRGSVWGGLVAPKGLPDDRRKRLEDACVAATGTEFYRTAASRLNNPLVYRDGARFRAFADAEARAYAAAVREFGLEEN